MTLCIASIEDGRDATLFKFTKGTDQMYIRQFHNSRSSQVTFPKSQCVKNKPLYGFTVQSFHLS